MQLKRRCLIVFLDGLEDPYNLGSIIGLLMVGAHGISYPKRRSVSVTPHVIKSSAELLHTCQ